MDEVKFTSSFFFHEVVRNGVRIRVHILILISIPLVFGELEVLRYICIYI